MKYQFAKSIVLTLALSGAAHAATVASVSVQISPRATPNPSNTFILLMTADNVTPGGTGVMTNHANGGVTPGGSTIDPLWTITGAGTLSVSYHLMNVSGLTATQGLYDASSGVINGAGEQGDMKNALDDFATLVGGAITTADLSDPTLLTTTYTIPEGSAAIGMDVAFGFHRAGTAGNPPASGQYNYIFGKANGVENFVTLDFEASAIPEPSTVLLGTLGLLALFRRRRVAQG